MRFYSFSTLTWAALAMGQGTYPNLAVSFLQTTNPVTPLPQGFPWGSDTVTNTNPYTNPPNTGVIRSYHFTISRGLAAPDGYTKSVLLVNNQFPGPLIEANWGDTIQVTVTNNIEGPPEGTALHWHGILQTGTQYFDGVSAVSQCPIAPNGTFTYTFLADLYGTSWYHSHYSSQYAGGLLGPMIIHGPNLVPYSIDIGPVLLTDYYHKDYLTLVEGAVSKDINKVLEPSVNNLINGHNNFNCSNVAVNDTAKCISDAKIPTFQFVLGATHRVRLINAGAEGIQKFSIDGHNLTIIAQDFVPVSPYNTQVVTLGVGQRTDVLVTAPIDAIGKSYIMRSTTAACSLTVQPNATAIVYYGLTPSPPKTAPWPALASSVAKQCENDPLDITSPLYSITPTPPSVTQNIWINFGPNATGYYLWTMNNSSFRGNCNNPILLLATSAIPATRKTRNGTPTTSTRTPRSASSSRTPPPPPTLCISTATISASSPSAPGAGMARSRTRLILFEAMSRSCRVEGTW